jgi:hypothetical protein
VKGVVPPGRFRSWALALILLATARSAHAETTALFFDSQAGDWIGGGAAGTYTTASATFTIQRPTSTAVQVQVDTSQPGTWWTASFSSRFGIGVGTFEAATRYPFTPLNGLSFSGSGRGCNNLTGRFVVYEFEVHTDGAIARFAADFEQHCEDGTPGLFGAIRFNSTIASLLPFGGQYPSYSVTIRPALGGTVSGTGLNCGTTCVTTFGAASHTTLTAIPDSGYLFAGWTDACHGGQTISLNVNMQQVCTAVFTPAGTDPNTLFYFHSQPGDYIGAGRTEVFSPSNSIWTVTPYIGGQGVQVRLAGRDDRSDSWWTLLFIAPSGTTLGLGTYYTNAVVSPSGARLDVFGNGRGCTSVGRFTISELVRSPDGTIESLAVDFEQRCTSSTNPPLVGSLRYHASSVVSVSLGLDVLGGGRVTMTPSGIACTSDCYQYFEPGVSVTLAAAPADGWTFTGWSGDADCSDGIVSMSSPLSCRATFAICTFTLSASSLSLAASGGIESIDVTVAPECFWSVQSTAPWLTVLEPQQRSGNGTFRVAVAPQAAARSRQSVLTIAAVARAEIIVTQAAGAGTILDVARWNIDGDNRSDIAVWRPGDGYWYTRHSSSSTASRREWGSGSVGDRPVPGDYDGDGVHDFAVWRPGNGVWYLLLSTGGSSSIAWGAGAAGDVPVPADFDGDRRTDLAVWRSGSGTWFIRTSSSAFASWFSVRWGAAGDHPVVGDYDGDGRADIAVWRPTTGGWFILRSHLAYDSRYPYMVTWGAGSVGDRPLTGDYDGDGATDLTVWRGPTGRWHILPSGRGFAYAYALIIDWGLAAAGDLPVVGDFDGDGRSDIGVWRGPLGRWFVKTSASDFVGSFYVDWGSGNLHDNPITR